MTHPSEVGKESVEEYQEKELLEFILNCKGMLKMLKRKSAIRSYCEHIQNVLIFSKCIYYKHTIVHTDWDKFAITDFQYDSLENVLKRYYEVYGDTFPVLDYVGFGDFNYIQDNYIDELVIRSMSSKIAEMCAKPYKEVAHNLFTTTTLNSFWCLLCETKKGLKLKELKF